MKSLNNLSQIQYKLLFDAVYTIAVTKDECNDYLSDEIQSLTDDEFEKLTVELRTIIMSKIND